MLRMCLSHALGLTKHETHTECHILLRFGFSYHCSDWAQATTWIHAEAVIVTSPNYARALLVPTVWIAVGISKFDVKFLGIALLPMPTMHSPFTVYAAWQSSCTTMPLCRSLFVQVWVLHRTSYSSWWVAASRFPHIHTLDGSPSSPR